MSKADKLESKLRKKPSPADFEWDELLTLMRKKGFKEYCQRGSHYTFVHSSGFKFKVSKTHPAGILKKYQIEDTVAALDSI